jgi:LysM repeat protein/flagellar biogenesis protein FliO
MKAKILLLVLSGILAFAASPVWGQEILVDKPVETATLGAEASAPAQPEVKSNFLAAAIPAEAKLQAPAKTVLPEKPAKPVKVPTYKVQNGDSLIVIANAYGVSVTGIMQANNLTSSSLLRVGQSLKIPGGVAPTGRKAGPLAPSKPAASQPATPPAMETRPAISADENLPAADQTVSASASLPAVPVEKTEPGYLFGEASKKTAGPNLLGGAGTLFSLVLKLGFVIILAYVAARAARRFALRNGKGAPAPPAAPAKNNSPNNMEILETITLGPERWIHIVTIGSKAYLLSSTPQQTALITEVTETNFIQELREKQALESGFAGQLAQCLAGAQEHRQRQKPGVTYANNFFAAKLAELNPFGGRQ